MLRRKPSPPPSLLILGLNYILLFFNIWIYETIFNDLLYTILAFDFTNKDPWSDAKTYSKSTKILRLSIWKINSPTPVLTSSPMSPLTFKN